MIDIDILIPFDYVDNKKNIIDVHGRKRTQLVIKLFQDIYDIKIEGKYIKMTEDLFEEIEKESEKYVKNN